VVKASPRFLRTINSTARAVAFRFVAGDESVKRKRAKGNAWNDMKSNFPAALVQGARRNEGS
jgi:hypothetical protein